jgi:hypothetical protein
MTEPKRRGRPTNAEREAKAALLQGHVVNGDTSREPEDVIALVLPAVDTPPVVNTSDRAQAYAMKVWAGQSDSIDRNERIARIERALAGQGLPHHAIQYPGSEDDEDWTEEDMQPVALRIKRA